MILARHNKAHYYLSNNQQKLEIYWSFHIVSYLWFIVHGVNDNSQNIAGIEQFLGSAQLQLAGLLPKFSRWTELFWWIYGRAPSNFTYQTVVWIHSIIAAGWLPPYTFLCLSLTSIEAEVDAIEEASGRMCVRTTTIRANHEPIDHTHGTPIGVFYHIWHKQWHKN
jgi:hypothetical protein